MDETVDIVQPTPAEREARLLGWVPKEEFRGDEGKWRSADEFLERGKEINAFLRRDMEKLHGELSRRDSELAEIKTSVKEFAEFHKQTEERAYKRALAELRKERAEAIREGDDDRAADLDDAIDDLRQKKEEIQPSAQTPKPQAQNPALDPIFVQWTSEESWYGKDKVATQAANALAEDLHERLPALSGRAFLDEVARLVRDELPNRFSSPRTRAPAVATESGNQRPNAGGRSRKQGYDDLPPEAKQACDRFVKQGLIKSADDYVKEYFDGE